ncbi:Aspartate/ornithine carbamoyltransferase [Ochromonadaceae sp. CCMP2298]|nr:Aspartate/ornithine carbamoyltransferase [Ochromonadaceae sp. CCMP2298]
MDLSSIAVGGMTSFSEAATSFKGLFKTEAPDVTTSFMKKRATTKECIPDHILTIRTLSMEFIELILASSDRMRDLVRSTGGDDSLKHKVLASVFYEPSTRTSCSFQAAMLRLGGTIVCVNGADSSVKKGESLEDTVQTMQCYCDIIALRHPDKGSAEAASKVAYKPIINAGDGTGEHPTQALLDLYTIKSELGRISGFKEGMEMTVTLLGDLKNGRTVHSLVLLLSKFQHVKLVFVAPEGLEMPAAIMEELQAAGTQVATSTLDEAITTTDVLYVTRIQKERFATEEEYTAVLGSYCVDAALMDKARKDMIVMHPLPRLSEIAPEVDTDRRAAYFRQMENGMYVRMAILSALLVAS